jgi:hypothetical protein
LVHFGLLAKERRDNDMHYWVTRKGRRFLAGEKSPSALFNSGALVHGLDPSGEMVGMDNFFSQEQQDEMKKPLWFLPQAYREQILTAEELLIGM